MDQCQPGRRFQLAFHRDIPLVLTLSDIFISDLDARIKNMLIKLRDNTKLGATANTSVVKTMTQ